MPTVRVTDVEMYYEQHGAGPDLLLIMGLGAHAGAWALQTPEFARRFKVTVFDNRGAGRTSSPDAPYSIRQMADDTAALMAALGIDWAHVVGVSMGGMIAQELAINHPERVDRLVLACSRAKAGPLRQTLAPAQALVMDSELPREQRALLSMPWSMTPAFMSEPAKVMASLELALKDPYPIAPHAYHRQQSAVMGHDTLDRLGRIRARSLVLVGAEDILTPVSESVELARGIPNAQLRVLPRGGHGFTREYPSDFNAAVLEFLT